MGAPDMTHSGGAEASEDQDQTPTAPESDQRSTGTADEEETHYMDESPSEDADVHYNSTTGESSGGQEE